MGIRQGFWFVLALGAQRTVLPRSGPTTTQVQVGREVNRVLSYNRRVFMVL